MENVDKIIANLNSDYPEPPQPQERKEYVPGGIPLSPAQVLKTTYFDTYLGES